MNAAQRTALLFDQAKARGAINPLTGDGMPSAGYVHTAILEAEYSAAQTEEDLATFVRRLVHLVRKRDPNNVVAAEAVAFLQRTGHLATLR